MHLQDLPFQHMVRRFICAREEDSRTLYYIHLGFSVLCPGMLKHMFHLQARIQMKNNIRFGAAKAIRTEAGLSYQRLIDRSCNMPNPWTTEILLKGPTT